MADPVAIVTGGSSGIGKATAISLAAGGFEVAVLDLEIGAAETSTSMAVEADVADPESVEKAIGQVEDQLGLVDLLVNNAGITGSRSATRLHETPLDEWDRVMAVNVRGPYLCSRAALRSMVPRRSGHIITVASVAGMVPFPARSAYSVSKGAAVLLAKSIALDYADLGIRSNAICPGMVETPMTSWRLDQDDLRAEIEARIPMRRVAQPEEIAEAIAALASSGLDYVNGHAMVVDGGWTVR